MKTEARRIVCELIATRGVTINGEAAAQLEDAIAAALDRAVAETLLDRMDFSEYKRRQAPPCLKISSKAFGVGRRMPIAKAGWRVRAGL